MNVSILEKTVNGQRKNRTIGIIIILIGMSLLGFTAIQSYKQMQETADYILVQGKVIGYHETRGESSKGTPTIEYAEIVEYQVGEKAYQIKSSVSKSNPSEIGSIMAVKYNQKDPSQAILPSMQNITRIIMLSFGGVVVAFGVLMEIKNRTAFSGNKVK